jgi:hypothetical protein
LVIHIHFNDFPGRYRQGGLYNGFSLYVPQEGYTNHETSIIAAEKIRESLNDFFPESNNPVEEDIIIEGPDLIAIGANNTLESASVLIEYGYIYESQFNNSEISNEIFKELAYRTYLGIKNLISDSSFEEEGLTTLLPEEFNKTFRRGTKYNLETLSLQAFLRASGFYPADGENMNECPITGIFGPCTEKAVLKFQEEYNLEKTGEVDFETIEKLNDSLGFLE